MIDTSGKLLIFTVYRPKSHRQIKSKVVDETLTNRYFFVKTYLSMHKANKQKNLKPEQLPHLNATPKPS